MFTQLTDLTKGVIFFGIAFGLALAAAVLIHGEVVEMVITFTPLVAAVIMLLVVTRDGYVKTGWANLGLHRLGLSGWPLALLVPPLLLLVSYSIVWSLGIATPNLPTGAGPLLKLALNTLIQMVFMTLFVLGEEAGWRGYLLPRLLALGQTRAMLLTGLLQGIWHLPLMLLTPFYHGQGNRLIIVSLFLLTLTVAGVFFGYLRLTTHSVWPAVLAHAALNTFWSRLDALTIASSPLATEYLAGESGLLTFLGAVVMAIWILYLLRKRPQAVSLPI